MRPLFLLLRVFTMKRWLNIILGSGFIVLGLGLITQFGLPERANFTGIEIDGIRIAPEIGSVAPPFQLINLNDEFVGVDPETPEIVILNFWATWCEPCIREMPELQQIHEEYEQVRVIGINLDERFNTVSTWVEQLDLSFDIVIDEGDIASLYYLRAQPTTFVIDKNGTIRDIIFGATTYNALSQRINIMLQEG